MSFKICSIIPTLFLWITRCALNVFLLTVTSVYPCSIERGIIFLPLWRNPIYRRCDILFNASYGKCNKGGTTINVHWYYFCNNIIPLGPIVTFNLKRGWVVFLIEKPLRHNILWLSWFSPFLLHQFYCTMMTINNPYFDNIYNAYLIHYILL